MQSKQYTFIFFLTFFFLTVTTLFLTAPQAFAKIGVGIGTGKITVDEPLKAGMVNKLPSITVVNTGDVTSNYTLSIQYHQDQKELLPQPEWFVFSPNTFSLEPGAVQLVDISLHLPLEVEPGNYFAYLEAAPLLEEGNGTSRVGIAAAAKLNFSIVQTNVFLALYYKVTSLWNFYQPWSNRVAVGLLLFMTAVLAKRYLKIELKGSTHKEKKETEKDA